MTGRVADPGRVIAVGHDAARTEIGELAGGGDNRSRRAPTSGFDCAELDLQPVTSDEHPNGIFTFEVAQRGSLGLRQLFGQAPKLGSLLPQRWRSRRCLLMTAGRSGCDQPAPAMDGQPVR